MNATRLSFTFTHVGVVGGGYMLIVVNLGKLGLPVLDKLIQLRTIFLKTVKTLSRFRKRRFISSSVTKV